MCNIVQQQHGYANKVHFCLLRNKNFREKTYSNLVVALSISLDVCRGTNLSLPEKKSTKIYKEYYRKKQTNVKTICSVG